MDRLPVTPTWRKPAGMALILVIIVGWAVIVASAADRISALAWPLQAMLYLFAGTVWIVPLKPLLLWMETGKWRVEAPAAGGNGASDGT